MNKQPELSLECTSSPTDFLKVTGENETMYVSAEELLDSAAVLLAKDEVIRLRDYCNAWLGEVNE